MPSVKSRDAEPAAATSLTEDEQQARLAAEIEKSEKLASSQLHMAEWFLAEGKADIARRRLQQLISTLPNSTAAKQARKLIKKL
jgi:TolA-binding protein